METYITGTNQRISVHEKARCDGHGCCVHGPSDHHMKYWPTNWRQDIHQIERICPHGVGHPDPDDVAFRARNPNYVQSISGTVHGCDGCCNPKTVALAIAKAVASHVEERNDS